jgi:hypothetical protein
MRILDFTRYPTYVKDVLEFIFQDGWHFFGVLVLIVFPVGLIANALAGGRNVNINVIVQDGDARDEDDEPKKDEES